MHALHLSARPSGTRFNLTLQRPTQRLSMNFVLQSPCATPAHKRFVQPLWLASLGWFIACVASVAVAGATIPQAGWAGGIASPAPMARLLPAADTDGPADPAMAEGRSPRSNGRCQSCGI